MKKLLAILLILSLTLTLLCSCKKEDAQKGGAEDSTSTEPQETTIDITATGNYYQDLTPPEVVEGNVTHQIYQAWWEDGKLVMQMYIINGMSDPIYDLFIENLYVYNEEGQIAQVSLGPLEMEPIPSGEYTLETFYFGYGVDLPDADLSSLSIKCVIDFLY